MKFLVILLCVVFGRVSAAPEVGKIASEEEEDVIVKVIEAMPHPRVLFDFPKIVYPGKKLRGVEDQKNHHSLPLLYRRSDNSESGELGTFGRPSEDLNHRSVAESLSRKWKQRPRINLGASNKKLNMLKTLFHLRISTNSLGNFHDGVTYLRSRVNTVFASYTRRRHLKRKRRSGGGVRGVPSNQIPDKLTAAMKATDAWEDKLLLQYVTNPIRTKIVVVVNEYNEAQREERWVLKKYIDGLPKEAEAEQVLEAYKALRTGKPSPAKETAEEFVGFFNTSSNLLTEYKDLKDNELEVDGYLEGTLQYPNEEEFAKEMKAKKEYKNLPEPVRNSADLVRLAKLHTQEAELLRKVETHSGLAKKHHRHKAVPQRADKSPLMPGVGVTELNPNYAPEEALPGGGSRSAELSLSVMNCLLGRLPDVLKAKIGETDEAEVTMLQDFIKEEIVPDEITDAYSAKQKAERELLKEVLKEAGTYAPQILEIYKAIRKGEPWTYLKLDNAFRRFFHQPSDALTEYQALKRDEFASLDAFLLEPIPTNGTANDEEKTDAGKKLHRQIRSEDEERARLEDDEKRTEMERILWARAEIERKLWARAEIERKLSSGETTTFTMEEMTNVGTGDDAKMASPDVNGTDDDVVRSPDNDTATEAAQRTKTRADKSENGNDVLLLFFFQLSSLNISCSNLSAFGVEIYLLNLYSAERSCDNQEYGQSK